MSYVWQGEKIKLRGVEGKDFEGYFNRKERDSESDRASFEIMFPVTEEKIKERVESLSKNSFENDEFFFIMEDKEGKAVGNINTHSCNRKNGTFKYGIGVKKEHWGNGYAGDAIKLVLRYYFNELGYQKANVSIYEFNDKSIKLHEKLEFKLEGRIRRNYYTDGKYFDELVYGITKEEHTNIDIIRKIKLEEDMFPKTFTDFEEKDFGVLFYNEKNKNSYDSNHAVIYKNKIKDLDLVLNSITEFYTKRNINPTIYQAVEDEGYFKEKKEVFRKHGYSVWTEGPNNIMILCDESYVKSSNELHIKLITEWDERIATDIFIPSDEDYEIEVVKNCIEATDYKVFVGYKEGKAIAIVYFHISEHDCCRFDYIIISKDHREKGYAREILSYVTDYCKEKSIKNCFQWPAHQTSERICYEAGFRHLFYAEAGRASYMKKDYLS